MWNRIKLDKITIHLLSHVQLKKSPEAKVFHPLTFHQTCHTLRPDTLDLSHGDSQDI